jgi:putative phosphoesterase
MIVGLLSDTHGRIDAARAGVDALLAGGADVLIHCGDVGGTDILDTLAGNVPAYFVFGNNDWDRDELERHAGDIGVTCLAAGGDVDLAGRAAAVMHGDDAAAARRVLGGGRHAYLFHGHTHVRADRMMGPIRVINPGALHRANPKTVALLDTVSGRLTFVELRVT